MMKLGFLKQNTDLEERVIILASIHDSLDCFANNNAIAKN